MKVFHRNFHFLTVVIVTLCCIFQIEPLEKEAMVVKDMYDLIDEYKVPTPPEDFAVYQARFQFEILMKYFHKFKRLTLLSAVETGKYAIAFL